MILFSCLRFELHDAPPNLGNGSKKEEIEESGLKSGEEFNMTVEVATQEEKQEWVDRLMMKIMIMNPVKLLRVLGAYLNIWFTDQ